MQKTDFVEQMVPIVDLVDRARSENKKLRAALKPFAAAVYNDNGDMTITPCKFDPNYGVDSTCH